jgi:hypothetical protein
MRIPCGSVWLALCFMVLPMSSFSNQCSLVQCHCDSFKEAAWRDQCLAREAVVKADCEVNQGQPKSFCGLQGPTAYPTALTGRPPVALTLDLNDKSALSKRLQSQLWSLEDSLRSAQERESSGELIQTIQATKILDQEAARLRDVYLHAQASLTAKEFLAATQKMQAVAVQVQLFGEKMAEKSHSQTAKKGLYVDFAFRLIRTAGTLNEYTAQLYAVNQQAELAAQHWQTAAELAQLLFAWETAGQNREQHLAFYRELESARWHRATLAWLATSNMEAVTQTNQKATQILKPTALVAESGEKAFD